MEKKRFEQKIIIPADEVKEMQEILNIKEGYSEDYGRKEPIRTYSKTFTTPSGNYGVDVKVWNEDTPYVDAVIYDIVPKENGEEIWVELFPIDVLDTLEGTYEFKLEENQGNVVIVLSLVSSENDFSHDWEPTDSQGYDMECSGCGERITIYAPARWNGLMDSLCSVKKRESTTEERVKQLDTSFKLLSKAIEGINHLYPELTKKMMDIGNEIFEESVAIKQ